MNNRPDKIDLFQKQLVGLLKESKTHTPKNLILYINTEIENSRSSDIIE